MREQFKGSLNHSEFFRLTDTTTGLEKTGIASGAVTASYRRTRGARVAITVSALTGATDAFTSGGWFEVDATNEPGLYRFDVPDAAYATGADSVVITVKATGARTETKEVLLVDWNKQVAAIPNVVYGAAGGIGDIQRLLGSVPNALVSGRFDSIIGAYASGMAPLQPAVAGRSLDVDASGRTLLQPTQTGVTIPTVTTLTGHTPQTGDAFARLGAPAGASIAADIQTRSTYAGGAVASVTGAVGSVSSPVTVGTINANAVNASALATDAVTEIQTGLATSAALTNAQTDLDDIQTRLPAALVGGRMDASVGAMATGIVTAAAIATDAIDADAIAASAVTEIQSGMGGGGGGLTTDQANQLAAIHTDYARRTGDYLTPTAFNTGLTQIDGWIGDPLQATDYVAPNNAGITTAATEATAANTKAANIQSRLPAALVDGKMDAVAEATVDATALANSVVTALNATGVTLTDAQFEAIEEALAVTVEVVLPEEGEDVLKTSTLIDGVTLENVLIKLLADKDGNSPAATDEGGGVYRVIKYRRDGVTPAIDVDYNPTTGAITRNS